MATQVSIENLSSWLSNQPANTRTTPYAIEITGITSENYTDLTDILNRYAYNGNRYVDLRATSLPDGLTDISNLFDHCSVCFSPVLPDSITTMVQTFYDCTLSECPTLPSNLTNARECFVRTSVTTVTSLPNGLLNARSMFNECALRTISNLPDSITDMSDMFSACFYLEYISNIPSSVINMSSTFAECRILRTIPPLPNGVENMDYTFNNCKALNTPITVPNTVTNMHGTFQSCEQLETPPNISTSVTRLEYTFASCYKLKSLPDIPNNVTYVESTFFNCKSAKVMPQISNQVTKWTSLFKGCESLETVTIPQIVTDLSSAFYGCKKLKTISSIPNGVTKLSYTFFDCTSLETTPVIPDSVTDITYAFFRCTSLKTVNNVPSSVTKGTSAFKGCTSLENIKQFEIPINVLKNNRNFESMFMDCPNLTHIGFTPSEESDWHAFRLKFGASTVEGKVYDQTGTAVTIPQTSVTKSTLKLPIKTDELWFPNGYTDAQIDEIIQKVIQYRYTYRNDTDVLDPAEKNFVLWADDPDKVKSNILPEIEYPIPESKGGTGQTSLANVTVGNATKATSAGKLTTARKVYVKLGTASTSETKDFSGDTAIPVNGTLNVANGGTGMTTASYKNAVVVGNSSTVTNALRTIRTANGAFYATAQDGAPSFGTLPVGQGGTGATSLANITVGNSSKLGNISVQTTSIGGGSSETGNHWSYVTKAKFTSTSGYIVYSNGLKIQWIYVTDNSQYYQEVEFPIDFSNTNYIVVANTSHDTGGGGHAGLDAILGKRKVKMFHYNSNGYYLIGIGY